MSRNAYAKGREPHSIHNIHGIIDSSKKVVSCVRDIYAASKHNFQPIDAAIIVYDQHGGINLSTFEEAMMHISETRPMEFSYISPECIERVVNLTSSLQEWAGALHKACKAFLKQIKSNTGRGPPPPKLNFPPSFSATPASASARTPAALPEVANQKSYQQVLSDGLKDRAPIRAVTFEEEDRRLTRSQLKMASESVAATGEKSVNGSVAQEISPPREVWMAAAAAEAERQFSLQRTNGSVPSDSSPAATTATSKSVVSAQKTLGNASSQQCTDAANENSDNIRSAGSKRLDETGNDNNSEARDAGGKGSKEADGQNSENRDAGRKRSKETNVQGQTESSRSIIADCSNDRSSKKKKTVSGMHVIEGTRDHNSASSYSHTNIPTEVAKASSGQVESSGKPSNFPHPFRHESAAMFGKDGRSPLFRPSNNADDTVQSSAQDRAAGKENRDQRVESNLATTPLHGDSSQRPANIQEYDHPFEVCDVVNLLEYSTAPCDNCKDERKNFSSNKHNMSQVDEVPDSQPEDSGESDGECESERESEGSNAGGHSSDEYEISSESECESD